MLRRISYKYSLSLEFFLVPFTLHLEELESSDSNSCHLLTPHEEMVMRQVTMSTLDPELIVSEDTWISTCRTRSVNVLTAISLLPHPISMSLYFALLLLSKDEIESVGAKDIVAGYCSRETGYEWRGRKPFSEG